MLSAAGIRNTLALLTLLLDVKIGATSRKIAILLWRRHPAERISRRRFIFAEFPRLYISLLRVHPYILISFAVSAERSEIG